MSKKSLHEENSICNIHNSIVLYCITKILENVLFSLKHDTCQVLYIAQQSIKKKKSTLLIQFIMQTKSVFRKFHRQMCVFCVQVRRVDWHTSSWTQCQGRWCDLVRVAALPSPLPSKISKFKSPQYRSCVQLWVCLGIKYLRHCSSQRHSVSGLDAQISSSSSSHF